MAVSLVRSTRVVASARQPQLSNAKNAHRTNTREQFEDALKSGANWFEGDIRQEINTSGLEMRHDETHETGDNLTLREWLTMGRASGRGLKLDVKEPQHLGRILDELERARIPQDKLMLNLGYRTFEQWGPEIRERFPNAILALNPASESKPIGVKRALALVDQAKRLGGPVTFVVRHDLLTDDAIRTFRGHGPVSVWGKSDDVAATTADLKRRGVDGMIDVEEKRLPSPKELAEKGLNWGRTMLDQWF